MKSFIAVLGVFGFFLSSLSANETEVFYHKDIREHKRKFIEEISADLNCLLLVLKTIKATDCDDIPKVLHAGEVFEDCEIPYQVMHNGVKILKNCYHGQWMTNIIYGLKGHHEPQEEKVFYEVLKYIPRKAVMLELGSFWAYYSLWFAKEISEAKNYLIEPESSHLEIGQKNFQLNNKKGHFYLGYAGQINTNNPLYFGVEKISIDDFLEKEKIEHLHILHSDIQGAESAMLETCQKSIAERKIDYFFISTHGDRDKSIIDFLKSCNYEIIATHRPTESCSADGLVVAKRKELLGPQSVSIRKYTK